MMAKTHQKVPRARLIDISRIRIVSGLNSEFTSFRSVSHGRWSGTILVGRSVSSLKSPGFCSQNSGLGRS